MIELILGLVALAAIGLVAYWRYSDTQQINGILSSYSAVVDNQIKATVTIADKVQRPWGDDTELADETVQDLIAKLDEEWLSAPESVVDFDEDLVRLSDEDEEA